MTLLKELASFCHKCSGKTSESAVVIGAQLYAADAAARLATSTH